MIWPFSRKPKPPNPGPINEDWAVGDLAECMVPVGPNGLGWPCKIGPGKGDVLKVQRVASGHCSDGSYGWGLWFGQYPRGYGADAFRKVPPLNSKASAEFTAQIKAIKPKERARRMAATARRAA
jgi:hypothetical protein